MPIERAIVNPLADGFFSTLGWERHPLSQLEMTLEL
jgi:hypothetical protein